MLHVSDCLELRGQWNGSTFRLYKKKRQESFLTSFIVITLEKSGFGKQRKKIFLIFHFRYYNHDSPGDEHSRRRVVCAAVTVSNIDDTKCEELMGAE